MCGTAVIGRLGEELERKREKGDPKLVRAGVVVGKRNEKYDSSQFLTGISGSRRLPRNG